VVEARSRTRSKRFRAVLALGVVAAVVVAIARLTAGPDVPTFRVDFPAGEIEGPLTVVVEDRDGNVAAVARTDVPDDRDPEGTFGSTPISGEASTVTLWWMGGACDRETTLRITTRPDGGLHVQINTDRGFTMSCPAVGILRAVSVQSTVPIDLSEIGVSYAPG
jgi:hypothetical protein